MNEIRSALYALIILFRSTTYAWHSQEQIEHIISDLCRMSMYLSGDLESYRSEPCEK